jgi:hypothetical protein
VPRKKKEHIAKVYGMKPLQLQAAGTPRKIVDYHLDECFDWVAELECGHQHVRHNPPWNTRHWVTSPQRRLEASGTAFGLLGVFEI